MTPRLPRTGFVALLAVLVSCGEPAGPAPAAMIEYVNARARWAGTGPQDYEFVLTRDCFCRVEGPLRVTVRGGVAVAVESLTPGVTLPPWALEGLPTLSGLLDIVGRALAEPAASLDVRYDAARGFPTRASIDWHATAIDDEIVYRVSGYSEALTRAAGH